jgi:hypothetical protein
MKTILITIVFWLFSLPVYSYELSQAIVESANQSNTDWVDFAYDKNAKPLSLETSKYEVQQDGSLIVPYRGKVWWGLGKSSVSWIRLSCSDSDIYDLGGYKDGVFETQLASNGEDALFTAKSFFCPIQSDKNKKILTVGVKLNPDGKTFSLLGFHPEDLVIDSVANTVKFTLYSHYFKGSEAITGISQVYEVNCLNQSIRDESLNVIVKKKSHTSIINTVCRADNILKMAGYIYEGSVLKTPDSKMATLNNPLIASELPSSTRVVAYTPEISQQMTENIASAPVPLPEIKPNNKTDKVKLLPQSKNLDFYIPKTADKSAIVKIPTLKNPIAKEPVPAQQSKDLAKTLAVYKKDCAEIGFKPKTKEFGECVLLLRDGNRTADSSGMLAASETLPSQSGDGSNDDGICQKYGFKVSDESYKKCRLELSLAQEKAQEQLKQYELAKKVYESQVSQYEEQKRLYEAALEEQVAKKQREDNVKLLTFGLGLATGRTLREATPALYGQPMLLRERPQFIQPPQPNFQNFQLRTPYGTSNCNFNAMMNRMDCR